MSRHLLFLWLVFPAIGFSQETSRKLLLGQIVADSMVVENITVRNETSNIIAVTDQFGKFAINAREQDTLVFSGMNFTTKSLVLVVADFDYGIMKIRLDLVINQLDEVVISPVRLTGNLELDSKKIKAKSYNVPIGTLPPKLYPEYERRSPTITTMPVIESSLTGINFLKIGSGLARLFGLSKREEAKPVKKLSMVTFSEAVKNKFSYHFFTQTLKIKPDEIGLFLSFCDTQEAIDKDLLDAGNEFALTDYLIEKSAEFHKIVKE